MKQKGEKEMLYRILAGTRKPVVRRLKELTGDALTYTKMPRCAFVTNGIAVEKDMTLVAGYEADMSLISILLEEGLIEPETGQEESACCDAGRSGGLETEEGITVTGPGASSDETLPAAEDASAAEDLENRILLPLEGHTGNSLRNLVFLIYSRGSLLSKATGGHFGASQKLIEKLKGMESPAVEAVIDAATETSGLDGIAFDREKSSFTGFPPFFETGEAEVFMQLVEAVNRAAKEQKRIQPKKVSEENEKYALRTWLMRIGMGGAKYKEARKRLLRDLSGNSAFRTEADKEIWDAKMKEKKEAGHEVSA